MLAVPLTHTGGLLSYTFTDWFNVTAGVVLGWDDSKNVNDRPSYTGQFAFTPLKDFTANLNWIAGPEQIDNNNHQRHVLDWVFNYTGFKNLALGLNVDYGHEDKEASLTSLGTRENTNATWRRWAAYVAYDWTEQLRTALRQEFFRDADGARTGFGGALDLWSTTATIQYKIWKGWGASSTGTARPTRRSSGRYSQPDRSSQGLLPRSTSLDTISISLHYLFF
jgi:hypothetical protein